MNPTIPQLDRWLDAHNMVARISRDGIDITLYVVGTNGHVSHHVSWHRTDPMLPDNEALGQACAIMARDCCLVPPTVALHLNKP